MSKAELVLVPTPGMGHLLSAVELAKMIVQRHHRFSVLVLIIDLPLDFNSVNNYVDSQSRDADPTGRLTFLTLPPLSNPPDPSSPNFFQSYVELHKPLVKRAVDERVESGLPKPAGFVLDMFCTTMLDVANELRVPSYIFFTSGASLLNLMLHVQSLADDQLVDIPTELGNPDAKFDLPGFKNRVPSKVIPGVFLDKEGGSAMILGHTRRFRESKGILVNTFMELEPYGIQTLLDQAKDDKIPQVYPVGPILDIDSKGRGGSRGGDHESIIRWLDEQPTSSVVFLCFGSMGSFSEDQVMEIANGLDRSGHRFLWALRRPPPEGKFGPPSENEIYVEALPEGFVERTAHKGKIIAWAPQVSILAHKAIGGFVSHCGWNSTLESLWFGVPMATWPMYAEQQLNAFQLVRDLGLAVEIKMDYRKDWKTRKGNVIVTGEEIEKGVKTLMNMDEEMTVKVREMRDKGRKAVDDHYDLGGGSSYHSLARFINDVLDNACHPPLK